MFTANFLQKHLHNKKLTVKKFWFIQKIFSLIFNLTNWIKRVYSYLTLKFQNNRFLTLTLISVVIFSWFGFFYRGITLLDPDFGWHIRFGEITLSEGLTKKDLFSYTMPSYNFVNHEWLTDLALAILYKHFNIFGLSIIFAIFALLATLIISPFKNKGLSILIYFLTIPLLLSFSGIRPQLISWFLFAVVLQILIHSKYLLLLPFIFLIWANLHGGFVIGLLVLLIYFFTNLVKKQGHMFRLFFYTTLCFATTFINPYGSELWNEIWITASNKSLRFSISEWMPTLFEFNIPFIILTSLSFALIIKYRKNIDLFLLITYLILLLFALSSIRNIPLWVIAVFPVLESGFRLLIIDVNKSRLNLNRFNQLKLLFSVVLAIIFIYSTFHTLKKSFILSEKNYYPTQAVNFLKDNQLGSRIFAPYGWGGYLLWKKDDIHLFIDGRMPSWKNNNPQINESSNAFADYSEIVNGKKDLSIEFKKYNVNLVVWHTEIKETATKKTQLPEFLQKIFKINNVDQKSLEERLLSAGWKIIYQDNIATIYIN